MTPYEFARGGINLAILYELEIHAVSLDSV